MVRAGQILCGKYRVDGLVGKGGMASVYRGAHLATGRRIAIKVLDDRFLETPRVVERFGREARAASTIQHESIVTVIDLDRTEEGAPFIVMEFLEGETLADRLERKGKLGEDEIVAIADPLLEALHLAHEAGVVHRDLKPENVMLVPSRRQGEIVKILDFGISSKADELSSLTQTGSLLGTPYYMSPEQARGKKDLDRRADVYAMGVVLYECAVGQTPFEADNYNALIQEILNAQPVPPRARGATISAELEAIILKALAKERGDRPSSAEEMRAGIIDVVGEPISSGTAGPLARSLPERVARAQHPTLDAPPETESVRVPTPVPEPIRSPLPPRGREQKIELDGAAVRRISRSTPLPRAGLGGEAPRNWLRIAGRAVVIAIVLIVVVRFVVRPVIARLTEHATTASP